VVCVVVVCGGSLGYVVVVLCGGRSVGSGLLPAGQKGCFRATFDQGISWPCWHARFVASGGVDCTRSHCASIAVGQ
jgi:hypothetical protein